jgi:hypothetical protein
MRDKTWSGTGYNAEEFYFERVNRELIQKLRETMKAEAELGSAQETSAPGAQVIPFPTQTKGNEKQKKAA